jgi:hypothetical protein
MSDSMPLERRSDVQSLEVRRMGEVLVAATRPQPSGKLFTLGISVFNGKSLLRNCIQSVINSTLPRDRYEIVVADDGSTEPETPAILSEFEESLAADPGFFPSDLSGDQLRRCRAPPQPDTR